MNCCAANASSVNGGSDGCPACGSAGTRVEGITLRALLTADGLRRGVPEAPRFCATETCPVVYFDNDAGMSYRETELTVRVHAKHVAANDVPVCYCFGYTPAMIEEEIARTGASTAGAMIASEVQAGHCACEVRNPKGSCCLGDVKRAERSARELIGKRPEMALERRADGKPA